MTDVRRSGIYSDKRIDKIVTLRRNSFPHFRRVKSVRRKIEKGEKVKREQEITLESVLGLTVSDSSSVPGGLLACPAGCVVLPYLQPGPTIPASIDQR